MQVETVTRLFTAANQNYRQPLTAIEAKATQTLWYEAFKDRRDDQMETALRLVMLSNPARYSYFPGIGDIQQALDELSREQRTKPMEQLPGLPEPATEYGLMCARLIKSKVFSGPDYDMIKGKCLDEVRDYAKSFFPEIGDTIIWRNYTKLAKAQTQEEYCSWCRWMPKDCRYNGYTEGLRLAPDGWLEDLLWPCPKRKEAINDTRRTATPNAPRSRTYSKANC